MGTGPHLSASESFDRTLLPQPSSVAAARGLVRDLLTLGGRDDLLDDALLVVSEVVTNALIHAGSPIRVQGNLEADVIRVQVSDASPHSPARRDYASTSGTGRGLALMTEIVDDWGVAKDEVGKTVWFELGGAVLSRFPGGDTAVLTRSEGVVTQSVTSSAGSMRERVPGGDQPGRARQDGDTDVVRVQLLGVPLLLHEAWREHVETLLREHLLACLDADDSGDSGSDSALPGAARPAQSDPIRVHAEAMDALALLEEQVPAADIDMDTSKLMAGASDPRVTAAELWLEVPRSSVAHFATLDRSVDEALLMVDSGRVLTPRTQPEVQSFRRWVCRQVEEQSRGGRAVAWSMGTATARRLADGAVAGDRLSDIMNSPVGLIAADQANEIVAISASAAMLLGYDRPTDLIGYRLVHIIPPRFHQAHIAGFTMHLLVGRSPLIGREVEVPALLKDGTEVLVRLEITARSGADGDPLFVAKMTRAED